MRCLLQREAAAALGIAIETYINWEKDRTRPVASQFQPLVAFLGYDPSPEATTLAERLQAKRRVLGVTFHQVVQYLGWDGGTLTRYLNGTWNVPPARAAKLDAFLAATDANLSGIYDLPRRRHS